jgi:hypothetical protein
MPCARRRSAHRRRATASLRSTRGRPAPPLVTIATLWVSAIAGSSLVAWVYPTGTGLHAPYLSFALPVGIGSVGWIAEIRTAHAESAVITPKNLLHRSPRGSCPADASPCAGSVAGRAPRRRPRRPRTRIGRSVGAQADTRWIIAPARPRRAARRNRRDAALPDGRCLTGFAPFWPFT